MLGCGYVVTHGAEFATESAPCAYHTNGSNWIVLAAELMTFRHTTLFLYAFETQFQK